MEILGWLALVVVSYFWAKGMVFYQTFYSVCNRAFFEAKIEQIKPSFLVKILEYLLIFFSAPLAGLMLSNLEAVDEAMKESLEKTAARFKDPENARDYLKAALLIWNTELEKEKK